MEKIQAQVASYAEVNAIHIMRAVKVAPSSLVLPGLGDIYRDPALSVDVEVRPAVITGNLGGLLELPFLAVAGIEDMTAAPTGAGFVVVYSSENVIENGACFLQELQLSLPDLGCQVGGEA